MRNELLFGLTTQAANLRSGKTVFFDIYPMQKPKNHPKPKLQICVLVQAANLHPGNARKRRILWVLASVNPQTQAANLRFKRSSLFFNTLSIERERKREQKKKERKKAVPPKRVKNVRFSFTA